MHSDGRNPGPNKGYYCSSRENANRIDDIHVQEKNSRTRIFFAPLQSANVERK